MDRPKRNVRVVELLRVEVTKAVAKVKDPRMQGFLTITDVTLSQDLKNATVFYSVMGTKEERKSTRYALKSAHKFIRGEVGRHLRQLRIIPEFAFSEDDTPRKASRIDKLLRNLDNL